MVRALFLFAALPLCAAERANPIRKVVTMLQNMQAKVEAEGKKEAELFEKFMCYCKTGTADLAKSIDDAGTKMPELTSEIEAAEALLTQTKQDLKKAQVDRSAAKTAMEEATAIREKEASEFSKVSTDLKTNLGAMGKAIAAMEKSAGAAFLQTTAATVLRKIVESDDKMLDVDRDDLTSFLQGQESSPGAIIGILKQMGDTMTADLDEATKTENAAVSNYDQLMAAKTKEVDALTAAIEAKTTQIGELGVSIVQMKEDLSDTGESFLEDKKFLAELDKTCATKEAEWAQICKTRQEELLALADTIKILNDDDALEMFKKTLPGAGASFMQLEVSSEQMRERALSLLEGAKSSRTSDRQRINYILLAIRGRKVNFDKVLKMIDDMVVLLKEEQQEDEHKKEYCEKQFDFADDKKKGLERTAGQLETSIADAKETIATLTEDVKALEDGIVALDKSVAEATENRKEENSDYKTLMANDAAAKDILAFAKNRLNKFYNPKLYKPPSFLQVSMRSDADPGPPPAAPGGYSKKSEESTGVIGMIDTLIKELDTEMTEAETEEKLAQEEYEELMADSTAKRTADSKSITEKTAVKGDLEASLAEHEANQKANLNELMATEQYISSLHGECDWLLQYFAVRQEARTGEIDSLKKAKAVLSGADFSFLEVKSRKFLRH